MCIYLFLRYFRVYFVDFPWQVFRSVPKIWCIFNRENLNVWNSDSHPRKVCKTNIKLGSDMDLSITRTGFFCFSPCLVSWDCGIVLHPTEISEACWLRQMGKWCTKKRNTNPINAKIATKATRYHTASSKDIKQMLWTIFTHCITQEIRDQGVMRRTGKKDRWQENREWGRGEGRERPSNSLLAAQNDLQLPHKRSSFRRHDWTLGLCMGNEDYMEC